MLSLSVSTIWCYTVVKNTYRCTLYSVNIQAYWSSILSLFSFIRNLATGKRNSLTTLSLSDPSRDEFLSASRLVRSEGGWGSGSGDFSVDLPSLFTKAKMMTLFVFQN